MSPRERIARMQGMLEQEQAHGVVEPHALYFTDPEKPAGQRFLGLAIVMAPGIISAVDRAHALGINPGGAVLDYNLGKKYAHLVSDPAWQDRLITSDEELELLGFRRHAGARS